MGLKNSPMHFQRAMRQVLRGLEKDVEIFIDDLILYGDNDKELLGKLGRVLRRLAECRVRVKLPKCRLGSKSLNALGHIVDGDGIRITEERKNQIIGIAAPRNKNCSRS